MRRFNSSEREELGEDGSIWPESIRRFIGIIDEDKVIDPGL
jgi:hypothetical protein